jgi:hypothetical protein
MAFGHVQSFEINGPTVLLLASKWQVRGGGNSLIKKFRLHQKFMLSYIENIEIAYLTSKTKAAQ